MLWGNSGSLWLVYIGLVSVLGLSGGDISSSQTGVLPSHSSFPVALLSFSHSFLTLPSLSPLISVYTVVRNRADVARVTSISSGPPVRMLCHDTETACEQKGNWEFWSKASEFTTCPTVHRRLPLQRIHTLLIFLWGCIKLLRAEAWQGEELIKKTATPFLFVLHFNFCIITVLIANTDRNRQVKALP